MNFETIQNLLDPESKTKHREAVVRELKKDVGLRLLYLSPELPFVEFTNEGLAKFTGLRPDRVSDYVMKFFQAGLWVEQAGRIKLDNQDMFRLGTSTELEHLNIGMGIAANLTREGPCWYENFVVSTNQELKRKFYKNVFLLIQDFIKESKQLPQFDSVVAWSHQGFDCKNGWNTAFAEDENEIRA